VPKRWHTSATLFPRWTWLWICRKSCAVLDWPVPELVRAVRVFLGLASFYQRFICDYATLVVPLMKLTQKGGFRWDEVTEGAF
jgi:hypothetical protein